MMRIIVRLTKDLLNPCIVMLTSFCENNKGQYEVLIVGDGIDDVEIEKLKTALSKYDITIMLAAGDLPADCPELPIDSVIDGDISVFFEGRMDDVLIAPDAHDEGLTYEGVKDRYPMIVFPDDKPWESTNVHYDIESIWWEYARKTSVYHEIMESFLESSLNNTGLEEYAIRICDENDSIRETINQTRETIAKILG